MSQVLRGAKILGGQHVVASLGASYRGLHTSLSPSANHQPLTSNKMPRSGGIASFMRLPVQENTQGLDACFVGIPLDTGASNRSGTRLGPRQIRCESVVLRPHTSHSRAAPFNSLNVADVGDVSLNHYNLPEACHDIRKKYKELIKDGCIPLTMGGDHTITYPILQAIKEHHGRVCLIHIDAHPDVSDSILGAKITHGTPFRRALEEDLIDPNATVQIGLRGTTHSQDANDWQIEQGFQVVPAEECWHKSLVPLMKQVHEKIGGRPVYLSFDIDAIDPGYCPGTGTPEIGGLTPIQALEIVRGCQGLNLVGCDLVEVSPPYDFEGTTALTAANLLFEMMCVLPGVKNTIY